MKISTSDLPIGILPSPAAVPVTTPAVGSRVIVTGATGGIGTAIVSALIAAGCSVVGIDRAEAIPEPRAGLLPADLADHEQAGDAVRRAVAELGGLDAVIGTAAIVDTLHRASTFPADAFQRDISANLLSQFWVAQSAYPALRDGGGAVLMFSSTAALDGLPGQAAYGASKAGVLGLVRTLAAEWGADGIRVNSIVPGLVATPAVLAMPDTTRERMLATVALRRLVFLDEIVGTAMFLLSPSAASITGQALRVDAGAGINTSGLHR